MLLGEQFDQQGHDVSIDANGKFHTGRFKVGMFSARHRSRVPERGTNGIRRERNVLVFSVVIRQVASS